MKILKIKRKTILIALGIILIGGFIAYKVFLGKGKPVLALERVKLGTVVRQVSETGTLQVSDEINLGFQTTGKIRSILTNIGDQTKAGQVLAQLDTDQLYLELANAQAGLENAKAALGKLIAGATPEDIQVAEAAVVAAQTTLDNAKQNLKDVQAKAQTNLDESYGDSLVTLNDTYLKMAASVNAVTTIQLTYFTRSDQEGIRVRNSVDAMKGLLDATKAAIDKVKSGSQTAFLDEALIIVSQNLTDFAADLQLIRDLAESPFYRDTVSSTDKTTIDTQRTNTQTAEKNIVDAQQTIALAKVTNDSNVNGASSQVATTQAQLLQAQSALVLKKASARPEDVEAAQASVKQAQAQVSLLQRQIVDAALRSPVDGQVTDIKHKTGEAVQATESVIAFLPAGHFQVKVNIYEENIVDVKIGAPATITMVAFPDQTFQGKVVAIDPADKLIDGVVYYEVTIDLLGQTEGMKQGMTADVVIDSQKKDNVLTIGKRSLIRKDGKTFVQVREGSTVQEREIVIGLVGTNDFVEVVSGLTEGQEIVID